MKIINASYHEQQLPAIWKKANVSPEEFIEEYYVKPAILDIVDGSQYGLIPNSSTTMALIGMLHHWVIN